MAQQAEAYSGLCSMKRLGVFLLPPGWNASPLKGYTQQVPCPRTQLNAPGQARTRTARYRVERSNHARGHCDSYSCNILKIITQNNALIDQFRYIKIQPKTIDLRTRLWGINPTNSAFIPQSLAMRSIVLG